MREIRTSGSMSEEGKRDDGRMAHVTAPLLDSTRATIRAFTPVFAGYVRDPTFGFAIVGSREELDPTYCARDTSYACARLYRSSRDRLSCRHNKEQGKRRWLMPCHP